MADVPSKKLRRGTSRLFTGSLRGSFAGEVPRRTGILTTEELLIDACKSVAYLLDSEASESQELEDGSEVGEETRDAAAMKVYPQVSQVRLLLTCAHDFGLFKSCARVIAKG
ncbi:unnamed protein product, partial [Polarella glacialis]